MLSMASLVVISSCKKDDDVENVKVTVTPSPSTSTLPVGSVLTLTIEATGNSDNKVTEILVTSSQSSSVLLSKSVSGTSVVEVVRDTIRNAGATYTYTVTVKGEKGDPATTSYTVQAQAAVGSGFTDALPNPVELYSQGQDSSLTSFMQLVNPFEQYDRARATFAANKAHIDLCFYYGSNNKFSLASPSNTQMQSVYSYITWTGAKTTQIAKTTVTPAQYDAIVATESDSAIIAIANGVSTWSDQATNLVANQDVLVYKTKEGKKGLIKVVSTVGTDFQSAMISIEAVAQR